MQKEPEKHLGALIAVSPDAAMLHAMTDPILTYDPAQIVAGVGASGIDYSDTD